jgi:hypothetical protein
MCYRTVIKTLYLTWVNDFLTISRFAEYHEMTEAEAATIITMGRRYHNEDATS